MWNLSKFTRKFSAVAALVAMLTAVVFFIGRHSSTEESSSRNGGIGGWQPIGGKWNDQASIISNRNYGRGDMLIAQNSKGSDYRISANIRFDLLFPETEYGDAGVVIRATNPEQGVNSYQGYYAGIRPNQQTLVLGRSSYDWHELRTATLITPIAVGKWYHLDLVAKGCDFTLTAIPQQGGPSTRIEYADAHCLTEGVAGLRSFYTQASWSDVQITGN